MWRGVCNFLFFMTGFGCMWFRASRLTGMLLPCILWVSSIVVAIEIWLVSSNSLFFSRNFVCSSICPSSCDYSSPICATLPCYHFKASDSKPLWNASKSFVSLSSSVKVSFLDAICSRASFIRLADWLENLRLSRMASSLGLKTRRDSPKWVSLETRMALWLDLPTRGYSPRPRLSPIL